MGRQAIEIVNELGEPAMKTCCKRLRLHVDDESMKIARVVCDANPRAENECRALGGTTLVNYNDAIEFAGGSSMRTSTWRASCRCFTACPPRGIPEVVSFR
jgi:phosphotransferase system IIB component